MIYLTCDKCKKEIKLKEIGLEGIRREIRPFFMKFPGKTQAIAEEQRTQAIHLCQSCRILFDNWLKEELK